MERADARVNVVGWFMAVNSGRLKTGRERKELEVCRSLVDPVDLRLVEGGDA